MSEPSGPIGIFDSGIGGLSIVRAIRHRLPGLDLIYLADTEHFPFGEKPAEQIRELTKHGIETLEGLSCKQIIIACNTATTNGLKSYQEAYPKLIISGVEPLLDEAIKVSKSQKIAVFATFATLASERFREQLQTVPSGYQVYTQAGYNWVRFAEAGDWENPEISTDIRYYLGKGVDTFVLGSTHFAFLADAVRAVAGSAVNILEPGPILAGKLAHDMGEQGGLGQVSIYATRPTEDFEKLSGRALDEVVSIRVTS